LTPGVGPVKLVAMPLHAFSRSKNLLIGAARMFDFQGSMTDSAYYRLFRSECGATSDKEALDGDMRKLGVDFSVVIEREQER
jgi:hypothetical protein